MNYYSHHIGDFDRATRHLTRIERSIYLDLIFVYYDTEAPLTLDLSALCRKVMARADDEKAAVSAVLSEFFHETPAGWFHDRCEEELEVYRKSKSQASAAGKASAAARAERRAAAHGLAPTIVQRTVNENPTVVERPLNDRATDVQRTVNELSTNQEPVTNNQEPVTKEKKVPPSALPDWLPLDSWDGYLEMRRKQKKVPTARAVELVIKALATLKDSGQDVAAVLDKSTSMNWTDVYPIRESRRATDSRALPPPSRHSGFESIDYSEGIEDGRIT